MHVLHVHGLSWPPGGAEGYLSSLCRLQEERGHVVTRLLLPAPEAPAWLSERAIVAPRSWGILSGLRCLRGLRRLVRRAHPDIIHLHRTQYALSPMIVSALRRLAPTVLSLHDVGPICYWGTKLVQPAEQLCSAPLGWGCFRCGCYSLTAGRHTARHHYGVFLLHLQLRAYRGMGKILVANRYLQGELLKNGFAPACVSYLPLFTEGGAARERITSATDGLILYVGRLRQEKGVLKLIEALDCIRADAWSAALVGEGPQLQALEHVVQERHLEQKIRFVGALPTTALAPYYARCRVVAFPSMVLENFGLVGIEAMSFGKPVVAFDVAGVREWLVDGETGFLVPLGDVKGFAAALLRLVRDPLLARRMGLAGRERVERLFRPATHLAGLEGIYQDVISRAHTREVT